MYRHGQCVYPDVRVHVPAAVPDLLLSVGPDPGWDTGLLPDHSQEPVLVRMDRSGRGHWVCPVRGFHDFLQAS